MRRPELYCAECSPYSRCGLALWVAIQTVIVLAGVCWLALNAAVFTGYLTSGDHFSVSPVTQRTGSRSYQQDSTSQQLDSSDSSSVVNGNRSFFDSNGGEDSSGEISREEHQRNGKSFLPFRATSRTDSSTAVAETEAEQPLEYAAVGKIKPNENGIYAGATAERMHGIIGLRPDGAPTYVPGPAPSPDIPLQQLLSRGGGFNIFLSDHLPLDREAVDARSSDCKRRQYDISQFSKASVVIIFYNEPFSTLLRSVHSVLNRTPAHLLEEILLVDDGSTLDYIKQSEDAPAETESGGKGTFPLASVLPDHGAAIDIYDDDEEDEDERRRVALLRSRLQQQRQSLPGSPNYRTTPTLVEYLKVLPEKVKLLRNGKRKGIVGARLHGIKAARAPVFVILDSHIEVQPQWLEPLLTRIAGDRRRIVMPQIDGAEADTLEYVGGGIGCKLGFLWKLMEHSYEPHQLARVAQAAARGSSWNSPHFAFRGDDGEDGDSKLPQGNPGARDEGAETSPLMAGGLFAADKKFFFEIGAYDEAFQYWGTENVELSFRLWQCGGRLECAPCSRVYHIFRKGGGGYSLPPHALTANKMRTLLWMDQYADLAWRVLGKPHVDFGWESLQQRKKWREEKKCKSFEWFLHNVYPESDVLDLADVPYLGPLKNKGAGACLSSNGFASPGGHVSLQPCHDTEDQDFMYFRTVGHIMPVRDDEACLEISGRLDWCRGQPKHEWKVTATGTLFHPQTQQCLSGYKQTLHRVDCDITDSFQIWSWTPYNPRKTFEFPHPSRLRGT